MAYSKELEESIKPVNKYEIVNVDGTLYKICPICKTLNKTENLKCIKESCNYEFFTMDIARETATQFSAEHLPKNNFGNNIINVPRLDK